MLHRRAFMVTGGSSLALFGSRVSVAQGGMVTRRSVRGMTADDPDLAAMSRAVARMKALPQSDARSWTRFADIHRNFCPHGNWYFLPWHRAYLLSFERVCRELSGKPDFALPYWNWTADRQFPAAFAAGDRNSNPLNNLRPGLANFRPGDDMVGGQVMSRIMASPDFEAFGSTRPRGQDSASSQWQRRLGSKTELEFNPHDGIHQAIGGNMSQVPLSARDPIFFLHHANIDRLWSSWNARGNANSPEAMWRNLAFTRNFINPDGSPWAVGVGDLGSTPALGYRYDDGNEPFAADLVLAAGDIVTEKLRAYRRLQGSGIVGAGTGTQRIELSGGGGAVYVASADNNLVAAQDRPIAITVPLGRTLGEIVGPAAFAARPDRPEDRSQRRYVWAFLRDLDQPLDPSTRVQVFCNCRDLTARTQLSDPSHSTGLSFFGGEHSGHDSFGSGSPGISACIDLTSTLARLDHPRSLRSDKVTIQLLPRCESREANVSNIRPRGVEVVIL